MTTLTYQDALDLKKCGFPQDGDFWFTEAGIQYRPFPINRDIVCPLLGELVRECVGEGGFRKLVWLDMNDEELALQKNILNVDGSWMAESYSHQKYGSTPEIAVKALYCALHKKPV